MIFSVTNEKAHGRFVAGLLPQPRIIDGAAIEPRGRSGLQTTHAQTETIEAIAQPNGRSLADAARRDAGLAHMDQALQERARGDDDGAAAKFPPACGDHARRCAILDDEVLHWLPDHFKIRLREDRLLHMSAIELSVRLRPRTLDSRSLGAVEHAELDARLVDHAPHQTVERIDLAHEMPFAQTADRRIAGHLADSLELMRNERRARAHAGGRSGRLAPGVPASHNNDVENPYAHVSNSWFYARHSRLAHTKEARVPPPEMAHANVTNVAHNGVLVNSARIAKSGAN